MDVWVSSAIFRKVGLFLIVPAPFGNVHVNVTTLSQTDGDVKETELLITPLPKFLGLSG